MAMTLRLTDDETDALRRRAQREGRWMQDVPRTAVHDYIERTGQRELLDEVLDAELPRYAEALRRLGKWYLSRPRFAPLHRGQNARRRTSRTRLRSARVRTGTPTGICVRRRRLPRHLRQGRGAVALARATHALVDGNKRLALASTIAFLGINGHRLTLSNKEAYDLVIAVATGALDDVDAIAKVLCERTGPRR